MTQRLQQIQEQKQVQQQRLTQQQLMAVRMIEMPIAEFEAHVQAEIDDNPALEIKVEDDDAADARLSATDNDLPAADDRHSDLDEALQRMWSDDEMPQTVNRGTYQTDNADYEEIVYGDRKSFYDSLREQMTETELTPRQTDIMDYLIGSLDSDGLLRKNVDDIADELAVYHNIDVSAAEVAEVLDMLKGFDPAGIGAGSLQECLLLQIDRKTPTAMTAMMRQVVELCYDDFMAKHYARIAQQTGIDESALQRVVNEIQKLNPKPGAALGETEGMNLQQITPDFVVDTGDDGRVTFYINRGHVPELYVSPSFIELIEGYKANGDSMNRKDKEALLYAKQRVDRAKGYIDAMRQRQTTMRVTMKAIVDMQHDFFVTGDESDLKPMVLKDVARRTGLDISTVSRVCSVKYALTRWGVFRLRHFFSEGIRGADGEEMSTKRLKAVMREIIDGEDKSRPLNDDALCTEMKKRGYGIARRTVTKYREQMGIAVARLRRQ